MCEGRPYLVIAAVLIALSESLTSARACDTKFGIFSGESAIDPIPMKSETGTAIDLNLGKSNECYVGVELPFPTRISFSLRPTPGTESKTSINFKIVKRIFNGGLVVIAHSQLPRKHHRTPTYELPSGDYSLVISTAGEYTQPAPLKSSGAAAYRLTVLTNELLPFAILRAQAGATKVVTLERYSGSAYLKIRLQKRSQIQIRLDKSKWPDPDRAKRPDYKHSELKLRLTDETTHSFNPEYSTGTGDAISHYTYTLNAGTYRMQIFQEQNQWPRTPLSDSASAADLKIVVENLRARPVPSALVPLARWLAETHLSDSIQVIDAYSVGLGEIEALPP